MSLRNVKQTYYPADSNNIDGLHHLLSSSTGGEKCVFSGVAYMGLMTSQLHEHTDSCSRFCFWVL